MASASHDNEYEEDLPEKYQGRRRWLGQEHHKGKEDLARKMKDQMVIQKTIDGPDDLSKTATRRLLADCKDGLELNVAYSLNKKNRWEDVTPIDLLRGASSSADAAVVERNIMTYDNWHMLDASKSSFAVHSRVNLKEEDPEDFDIRTARCSGRGQDLSNFAPESRELSVKKPKKKASKKSDEGSDAESKNADSDKKPTILYNILQPHRNKEMLAGGMSDNKSSSKSKVGQRREKGRAEMKSYRRGEVDESLSEYSDEESEDIESRSERRADLTEFFVEKTKIPRQKKKSESITMEDYEIVEQETQYKDLVDLSEHLRNGYTFIDLNIIFNQMKATPANFEKQIGLIREDTQLVVKKIDDHRYSIDASKYFVASGEAPSQMYLVVVMQYLGDRNVHVLINSTIPRNPSGFFSVQEFRHKLANSDTLLDAVKKLVTMFVSNLDCIKTMKAASDFYEDIPLEQKLLDAEEWKKQMERSKQVFPVYEHQKWTNSELLANKGSAQDFELMCDTVRDVSSKGTGLVETSVEERSSSNCFSCGYDKVHRLFKMADGRYKCTLCLQDTIFRALRAANIPLELQFNLSEIQNNFDVLLAVVPLAIVNLYIKMIFKNFVQDIGSPGTFKECPSCSSLLCFEKSNRDTDHLSCSACGHYWCSMCSEEPHWPMTCSEYKEWKPKWKIMYAFENAQGDRIDQGIYVVRVTCKCATGVFEYLMPTRKLVSCPACNIKICPIDMDQIIHKYVLAGGRTKKRLEQFHPTYWIERFEYKPQRVEHIMKPQQIRRPVVEKCSPARSLRFDPAENRKLATKLRNITKGGLDVESFENLSQTVLYLTENVTGWMYMIKLNDKEIDKKLGQLEKSREAIVEKLDDNNETVVANISKLKSSIEQLVKLVNEKLVEIKAAQFE